MKRRTLVSGGYYGEKSANGTRSIVVAKETHKVALSELDDWLLDFQNSLATEFVSKGRHASHRPRAVSNVNGSHAGRPAIVLHRVRFVCARGPPKVKGKRAAGV